MRARILLASAAVLAAGLPALAQNIQTGTPTSPASSPPVESNAAVGQPSQTPSAGSGVINTGPGESATGLIDIGDLAIEAPPPPVEIPDFARRDPTIVGGLDPVQLGLGSQPWGDASGAFLSSLMRNMETPLASRWAHIALRNALFARTRAPRMVHPVDWTAERAWLLLRMGEADAARMLVAGVDVDDFTPKMFQVGMQSALATADPSALCPLQEGLEDVEERVFPLIDAMCAALSGEPESAAAQIESARRRGPVGGIDLTLAEKVVGAGTDTGRAVTIEWDPVERVNAWRFGLATATGLSVPDRLMRDAAPQLRAWHARAPVFQPQQRLESARIATSLGVFSSDALTDVYSAIYDATDPNELSGTDAWQFRLAFVGETVDDRLAAMRRLWGSNGDLAQRDASRALLARAAALVPVSPDHEQDAPNLIASMLAGGLDRHAARWIPALRGMDDRTADQGWAMLALAAPETGGLDLSFGRINAFVSRDESADKARSGLLVAALLGLGRIDGQTADRLNQRHGLGIERRTRWTRMIDRAAELRQPATVLVLTGTGFQAPEVVQIPSSHMLHAVAALRRTGQDFTARMIAAEALART